MGQYGNTNAGLVKTKGGAERLTVASTVAQGSNIPCSKVFIQATTGNAGVVRMNVSAAASAALGIVIPTAVTANHDDMMELDVQNVNMLYFFGTNTDTIDILWVR